MEKNGHQLTGQKSHHIAIRYFFIKDQIEKGEINLVYCSTKHMIDDFFSEPLQGSLFHRFCEMILGVTHPDDIQQVPLKSQERVEDKDIPREYIESTGSNESNPTVSWRGIVVGRPKNHVSTADAIFKIEK